MKPDFAAGQLRAFVERIERLEEEKKQQSDDIKDVYQEAKSTGFDVTALRQIIKLRKMDADERAELEAIIEVYMQALEDEAHKTRKSTTKQQEARV